MWGRDCIGGMIERGSGHIVNICSDAGRRIFPSLAIYSASKFFVEAISEGLRREVAGTGLKATTIQPGECAPDLILNNTDKEAAEEQGVTIDVKVDTGSTTNQLLQPTDVAAAVLHAVAAPSHVVVNEVLVEARDQARHSFVPASHQLQPLFLVRWVLCAAANGFTKRGLVSAKRSTRGRKIRRNFPYARCQR